MVEKVRNSNDKIPKKDDLSALDGMDIEAGANLARQPETLEVAQDILADIGKSNVAKIIQERGDTPFDAEVPRSFDEMMDTSIGTAWQRLRKWYFKVGDPERNIKFFESIGVDKYRNLAKWIILDVLNRRKKDAERIRQGKNTNYTLAAPNLNSLLDFATNQTTFNEAVHLMLAASSAEFAATDMMTGDSPALSAVMFMLNLYCVLAQRYTRSKLSIAIDRMLESHPKFDAEKYENRLGIRLPQSKSQ